jgi:hypothetical protein
MKKSTLFLLVLPLLASCSSLPESATAVRAAKSFACKVAAVEPYFDDVDAAKQFVQDVIGRKIDPVAALQELGVALEEIEALGVKFKACSPSEPIVAPAPAPGRELG